MTMFACSKCGCCENSASTNAYWQLERVAGDVARSYREVLGLPADAPLGRYCSASSPVWYTEAGDYGIGPNPNPIPGEGLWHGRFKRVFLPKGFFCTNAEGDLAHVETLDEDILRHRLDCEDPEAPRHQVPAGMRLPLAGSEEGRRWLEFMSTLLPTYRENAETRRGVDELGGLPRLVGLLVDGRATIGAAEPERAESLAEVAKKAFEAVDDMPRQRPAKACGSRAAALMAAFAGLALTESPWGGPRRRRPDMEPREITAAERAAEAEKAAARIAAAEAKRSRRAVKRREVNERLAARREKSEGGVS